MTDYEYVKNLEDRCAELERYNSDLNDEVAQLEGENKDILKELSDLEMALDGLKVKYEEVEEEKEDLEKEKEVLEKQFDGFLEEVFEVLSDVGRHKLSVEEGSDEESIYEEVFTLIDNITSGYPSERNIFWKKLFGVDYKTWLLSQKEIK